MPTEKQFDLNSETGTNFLETPKLKGQLDSIIIDSEVAFRIVIESELGYIIFNKHGCVGINYLPIRVRPVDNEGHGLNYSSAKYYLNEKLRIGIFGQQNKNISIKFRFL